MELPFLLIISPNPGLQQRKCIILTDGEGWSENAREIQHKPLRVLPRSEEPWEGGGLGLCLPDHRESRFTVLQQPFVTQGPNALLQGSQSVLLTHRASTRNLLEMPYWLRSSGSGTQQQVLQVILRQTKYWEPCKRESQNRNYLVAWWDSGSSSGPGIRCIRIQILVSFCFWSGKWVQYPLYPLGSVRA